MNECVKLLDIFPCCESLRAMCGGLEKADVSSVNIKLEQREARIRARFAERPAPAELNALERSICMDYALSAASIIADYPEPEPSAAPSGGKKTSGAKSAMLLGKAVKGKETSVGDVNVDSGSVILRGRVFGVDSREVARTQASVLSFNIYDGTGSIHVSKYLRSNDPEKGAVDRISDGMYVEVGGVASYNNYEDDIAVEPKYIKLVDAPPVRMDKSEEKRVELHMHTRYSTLDALSDPAEVVARAAQWGHPAVAITDHGCAQAFPEAWHAAEKNNIKVIYGIEGYYVNDVDENLAVHGGGDAPLDGEIVAFDIETTGLRAGRDRIIEIGAVIFLGKKIIKTFDTFVDPEMDIPPRITELTGICDSDVAGAPKQVEALKMFLDFAGGRPLAAHNADFDVGFLSACARENGVEFDPLYIDTLVLSRMLLPNLKAHKLLTVSNFLSLPDFEHHRANDDALVVARIMDRFIPMLEERGAHSLGEIGRALSESGASAVKTARANHIILLVKNKTGLKNLYKLISSSYLDYYHNNPRIPKSLLRQYREGLIIGSACEAGELFRAVVRGKSDEELMRIASFYDYLEIQPICNNRFLIAAGEAKDEEELREYNRTVARIARRLGKRLVATGDVHFIDPEDEEFRHVLMAARNFKDADAELPIYFKTTDEMLEEFAYLGEAECHAAVIDNPVSIAEECENIQLLPKKQLFAPKIENSEGELKKLVYDRMRELYGENPPDIVRERVETELNDILSRHYDVIYMSAQKLVADSLAHGYLVGSRGSVGSSIVAFLSGITEVNSLPAHYRCPQCKHTDFESGKGYGCGADMPDKRCPVCGAMLKKDGFDIPFETFLGFGGDKVPDIDLNFSGEYQANAHKYTETLFGSDHVFRAGTIGTLAEKTAYGYVKKYLEMKNLRVTKAEETRLALGCVGVKRTTGQHPGGLVIIPQDMDVTDFCPVQHPADDPDSSIITTHFEYHCMEDNLLKLDELGHDDPTMIRMLEDMTGVNAKEIPLDDPETMRIFRSPEPLGLPDDDPIIGKTGTIGIPEFGTGFTRQMLVDTQPEAFDILVRLSGFSHGTDVWLGNAKELIVNNIASVKETVGCRDDIMLYLISKGMEPKLSFKIMESVRKGKVKRGGFEDGWVETMRGHGVPDWYIDSLSKIAYLFPKAHAVAYVMMAFRIAWFKVHKPLEFYAAYFYRRSQKDSFDAEIMTSGVDNVRKKIRDIRQSADASAKDQDLLTTLEAVYEFYMRGLEFERIDLFSSDATRFVTVGENRLRPPFVSISGLGEAAANDLAACKSSGKEIISVEDVAYACPKVSQTHIETLKRIGTLGNMPDTSQITLF